MLLNNQMTEYKIRFIVYNNNYKELIELNKYKLKIII